MNDTDYLVDDGIILLFYREFEADKFIKYDRYLKRILRPVYEKMHHHQKKTGFAVSFDLMCRALRRAGYDVRVNDYRLARRHPDYPVGLVGFPVLLDGWNLPNPAVLGPTLHDHPMFAPDLMKDPRYKRFAVLAPWTMEMFRPVYGDACFSWFAAIDLAEWPDLSVQPKTYDFLVYDKIRWDRERFEHSLIAPILARLAEKGLSYRRVRYRMHDHQTYRDMLAGARGLLFLCEHETQGLAYQEAMASGLPVLAWDPGHWCDPRWRQLRGDAPPPKTCSVPFFSAECGERFRQADEFPAALERFLARRSSGSYAPRRYVAEHLGMAASANLYAEQYFGLLERRAQPQTAGFEPDRSRVAYSRIR